VYQNEGSGIVTFIGIDNDKIEMLFVRDKMIGQGIGKLLLLYAINNLHAKRVDVNEQNPSAVEFYKYMGFKIKSRSPVDDMGKPFPILHLTL